MMEMTAEVTASVLDNLLKHGSFNVVTRNAVENAVRLLKQYPVTCGECKKNCSDDCLMYWNDINTPDDWYCRDGVRKER